jgi:RHS repeat-associated protein
MTLNYGLARFTRRLVFVTALTSASQTLTSTYRYDPWGGAIGGSGSAYNPFEYTATYKDAATGLYQMGARYYQPASGFTQLDPHPGQLLTVNRFAYTGCNPTNYTDPTGLSHCHPLVAIATALGFIGELVLLVQAWGVAAAAFAALSVGPVAAAIALSIITIGTLILLLYCLAPEELVE